MTVLRKMTDRRADRQKADKQTNKQINRQTDKQTGRLTISAGTRGTREPLSARRTDKEPKYARNQLLTLPSKMLYEKKRKIGTMQMSESETTRVVMWPMQNVHRAAPEA